jgi:hypothetical protein
MYRRDAELVAEGCMNKAIIDEIVRGKDHEFFRSRE